MLAESEPIDVDFIDFKMLTSLCKYQGRKYSAQDKTLNAIGQQMSLQVLQKTNAWLNALPFFGFHEEPERYWQVAGSFKQFTWGKLFLPFHEDKKVFLQVL